jgi:hypothetical protein
MKLYVDDVRTPPPGWGLARTVKEATDILGRGGVDEVSLDYMIGETAENNFSPVARFIAGLPEDKRPRVVHIHTASSHGARELHSILEGFVKDIRTRQS